MTEASDGKVGTTETPCPRCGNCIRVTKGKPTQVTCPQCGRVFDWEPYVLESADVHFRCAVTGKPFVIAFERNRPSDLFRIRQIHLTDHAPQANSQAAVTPTPHNDKRSVMGHSYDPADFSFRDFECPGCKFKRREPIAEFVQCSKCKELVCSGRVAVAPDGNQMFRCHDRCGGRGNIEGLVTSIEGREDTAPQQRVRRSDAAPGAKLIFGRRDRRER